MPDSERTPRGRPPLPARLLGIGARGAERVASATGIDDALGTATEEAIVRALESPAVEQAIVRVLESEAAQDALQRTLSSPAVERTAVEVLDSQLVDHIWDHLLDSDEAQKLIVRIAEAPELRAAIASQGVGLLADIGRQIRNVAMKLDDGLQRFVRRVIGRPSPKPTDHIGLLTRSLAMLLDGVILNVIFLAVAALFGFVVSAISDPNGVSTAGVVFGLSSWVVFGSAYLLIFWSAAGQTPGMRLLSIRIEDHDGSRRLGFRSGRRRLVGLIVALIPFGLGLLGLLTRDDRRGLWDRRAGTDVIVDDRLAPP